MWVGLLIWGGVFAIAIGRRILGRRSCGGWGRGSCRRLAGWRWMVWSPRTSPLFLYLVFSVHRWLMCTRNVTTRQYGASKLCGVSCLRQCREAFVLQQHLRPKHAARARAQPDQINLRMTLKPRRRFPSVMLSIRFYGGTYWIRSGRLRDSGESSSETVQ